MNVPVLCVLCSLLSALALVPEERAILDRPRRSLNEVLSWARRLPKHAIKIPSWLHPAAAFDCTEPGYFADPRNCKQFYRCIAPLPGHFVRFVFKCNGDRVYSTEMAGCVKPGGAGRAKCAASGGAPRPTTARPFSLLDALGDRDSSSSTKEPPAEKASAGPLPKTSLAGLDPSPRSSTESAESTTEHSEPPFDPSGTARDDEEETETPTDDWGETTTETATETSAATTSHRPNVCVAAGFFSDPTNCRRFYRCVPFGYGFIEHAFLCPRGTVWDDQRQTCNFPTNVASGPGCEPDTYPPPTLVPPALRLAFLDKDTGSPAADGPTGDKLSIVCPSGFRRHPEYCNAFYQCTVNDRLEVNFVPFGCPEGTIFDEEEIRCGRNDTAATSAERDGCAIYQLRGRPGAIPVLKVGGRGKLCPGQGRFPYGETCPSKYFECVRDDRGHLEGYLIDCPAGQLYSTVSNECVPPTAISSCAPRSFSTRFYARPLPL